MKLIFDVITSKKSIKMSLYDDLDTKQISDWSSGINKLMQPQLNLKNKQQQMKKNLVSRNIFQFINLHILYSRIKLIIKCVF